VEIAEDAGAALPERWTFLERWIGIGISFLNWEPDRLRKRTTGGFEMLGTW
jgi:hypothetical protein